MLKPKEREELRRLIVEQIANMEESIRSLQEIMIPVSPDAAIGRISRMDSLVNQGTAELALNDAQKRIGRLRDKLTKIDDPDFGKCAGCGEWIPIDRLRAAADKGVRMACMKK